MKAAALAVASVLVLGSGLVTLARSAEADDQRLRQEVVRLRHQHETLVQWVRVELRPWVIRRAEEQAESTPPPTPPSVEPLPTVPPEAEALPPSVTPEPSPSSILPTEIPSVEPSPTCVPIVDVCVSPGTEPIGGEG